MFLFFGYYYLLYIDIVNQFVNQDFHLFNTNIIVKISLSKALFLFLISLECLSLEQKIVIKHKRFHVGFRHGCNE